MWKFPRKLSLKHFSNNIQNWLQIIIDSGLKALHTRNRTIFNISFKNICFGWLRCKLVQTILLFGWKTKINQIKATVDTLSLKEKMLWLDIQMHITIAMQTLNTLNDLHTNVYYHIHWNRNIRTFAVHHQTF